MPSREDLIKVRDALESATEPSRDLDVMIGKLLFGWIVSGQMVRDQEGFWHPLASDSYPRPTSSMDDALALVLKRYPDADFFRQSGSEGIVTGVGWAGVPIHWCDKADLGPAMGLMISLVATWLAETD